MVPAPTKLSSPGGGAATSTACTVTDQAASRLRSLASPLPQELITSILEFAASTSFQPRQKLTLLLLSKYYTSHLSPFIYSTITLVSSNAIHSFASLVKSNPKLARHVRRLWVGPDSSSSDLITALSPPCYNEAGYITDMREHIHTSVRTILRSCRKLQDVALAGELLSLHAAHTYGSACQPVRLTSINPHSFVAGFSAPIFRKVKVLRIVDTNLAFEEADQIRTLAELEWLVWSSPKDYGDISRDSRVLRRLLQRPRRHFGPPPPGSEPTTSATTNSEVGTGLSTQPPALGRMMEEEIIPTLGQVWSDLSALELSEGLAPARPSKNDKFRRLTIQTAYNRCLEFRHLLSDAYPFYPQPSTPLAPTDPTGGLAAGLDATLEDLQSESDASLNVPIIHPTVLAAVVLDEWDALRDLINNAGGQYTNLDICDQGEQSALVDAGNALRRQRNVWERISDVGPPLHLRLDRNTMNAIRTEHKHTSEERCLKR